MKWESKKPFDRSWNKEGSQLGSLRTTAYSTRIAVLFSFRICKSLNIFHDFVISLSFLNLYSTWQIRRSGFKIYKHCFNRQKTPFK